MSQEVISENDQERARLLPVVGGIAAIYVVLINTAYFVGNLIHQIP